MLSIAFVEAALRARRQLPGGHVTGVSVLDRQVTGSGATVARLAIAYSAEAPAEVPRRVVAKIAAGEAAGPARRELRFYRLAGPRLAPLPAPRLVGAAFGFDDDRLVLLFEDLEVLGYMPAKGPVSTEALDALTDLLADLHAPFWGGRWPQEMDFSEPQASSTRQSQAWPLAVIEANAATGRAAVTAFLESHEADLGPDDAARLQRLAGAWPGLIAARSALGHVTLIHGDFHLVGNVFLKAGAPPRAVDWSEAKPGLGPHDLAYALISQATPDRASRDDTLVARYHARLLAAGVQAYPLDQALWDYRLALLTNLFQAARQSNLTWMRKTLSAAAHLGAWRLLEGWRG
jgi:hypothetical protein